MLNECGRKSNRFFGGPNIDCAVTPIRKQSLVVHCFVCWRAAFIVGSSLYGASQNQPLAPSCQPAYAEYKPESLMGRLCRNPASKSQIQ